MGLFPTLLTTDQDTALLIIALRTIHELLTEIKVTLDAIERGQ